VTTKSLFVHLACSSNEVLTTLLK